MIMPRRSQVPVPSGDNTLAVLRAMRQAVIEMREDLDEATRSIGETKLSLERFIDEQNRSEDEGL